jgi:flagellar secretion chaperone FliS
MQQANLYSQYKEQTLSTLTNGEIVIKLFEEASKQVTMSIFLINKGDSATAFNCILKTQKIMSALRNSLDMKYPISSQISPLYAFIYEKLAEASMSKDVSLLKDLLTLIDDFKVTFRQADKLSRMNK